MPPLFGLVLVFTVYVVACSGPLPLWLGCCSLWAGSLLKPLGMVRCLLLFVLPPPTAIINGAYGLAVVVVLLVLTIQGLGACW